MNSKVKQMRELKRQGRAVALMRQAGQLLNWTVLPVGDAYLIGPKAEVMAAASLLVESAHSRVKAADSLEIKSVGDAK